MHQLANAKLALTISDSGSLSAIQNHVAHQIADYARQKGISYGFYLGIAGAGHLPMFMASRVFPAPLADPQRSVACPTGRPGSTR